MDWATHTTSSGGGASILTNERRHTLILSSEESFAGAIYCTFGFSKVLQLYKYRWRICVINPIIRTGADRGGVCPPCMCLAAILAIGPSTLFGETED